MYRVGDIISVSYGDFEGNPRVGLFLIIYGERQDRSYSSNHSNLTCAKITSNAVLGDAYMCKLYQGEGDLNCTSFVNLSKLQTFEERQVIKRIGTLRNTTMLRVFKEFKRFNRELEQQILDTI